MRVLEIDSCKHLALRALSLVTHRVGEQVRRQIAQETPTLIRKMQEYPSDRLLHELAITTVSHAISVYTNVENNPDLKFLGSINMPRVLKVTLESVRDPEAPLRLIDHAVSLFVGATAHCHAAFHANPSLIHFLVAGLRSSDVVHRCTCLGGIIRLFATTSEQDLVTLDPRNLIQAVQNHFPGHLNDILRNYGFNRCETTILLSTTRDYQRAMLQSVKDHDLCVLGTTLAELITRTEFAIADGFFEVEDVHTGKRSYDNGGLPFTRWRDALHICATRLRAKPGASEADLDHADILDLKYFVMNARIDNAVALAKSAISRNPTVGYFYYIVTLSANHTDGLQHAKKGMKCPPSTLTPFLRFQMMQRAVNHAGDLGIGILQDACMDRRWQEGIALLTCSLEDAKTYVQQAPPDNRNMRNVLYWYILLTLALKGPEISESLGEMEVWNLSFLA
jgi:hypothetical protein